jgi:hypothetical protein
MKVAPGQLQPFQGAPGGRSWDDGGDAARGVGVELWAEDRVGDDGEVDMSAAQTMLIDA